MIFLFGNETHWRPFFSIFSPLVQHDRDDINIPGAGRVAGMIEGLSRDFAPTYFYSVLFAI